MSRTSLLSRPSLYAAALGALIATAALPTFAQSTPWQYRVRAVNIDSADKDSTGLGLSLSRKTIPEFDITYFFTPHLATELILTVPQRHKVYSRGTQIGSVKHLPPTLTLQYHFNPEGTVRPYIGAGVNYTMFSGERFEPGVEAVLGPSIKKNSFGMAAQIGVDLMLNKQWSINLDLKKLQMDTEIRSFGANAGKFKVDPVLVGLGVGYRF